MKAKHIKKLRGEIRHYYIALYDDWTFGFKHPLAPADIKKRGYLAYGRNAPDAIKRHARTSLLEYRETNWMFATWAAVPVDKFDRKFITYWRHI